MQMSRVRAAERETYEAMWRVDGYAAHSPGAELASAFADMARPTRGQTALDAGCGSGKGAIALEALGLSVRMCDITDVGVLDEARRFPFETVTLWEPLPVMSDWVYCCDVLEHIPEAMTMLVIARLLEASKLGVFLSISLVADNFGVFVGKPLHQTVKPFTWWRDQLAELAEVVECRDLLTNGLYLLRAR
jgi:SAM-dependent methyltransferase